LKTLNNPYDFCYNFLMDILKRFIGNLIRFFEKLDRYRDKVLFVFIKPYWPRLITPNMLTALRVAISIFLFFDLFYYRNDGATLVISLFFVGITTDLLDGSVARGLSMVTRVGAMMDPTADRLLIIPIAIYSLYPNHKWLLLIMLFFELINALISIYGQAKGKFMESNIFGKIKMLLQSVVFMAILFYWPNSPALFFIYILWISVTFIILSLYVKTVELKNILNKNASKNLQHPNG